MLTTFWEYVSGKTFPYVHCSRWDVWATTLYAVPNLLIALSFLSIPIILITKSNQTFKSDKLFWGFTLCSICYAVTRLGLIWQIWSGVSTLTKIISAASTIAITIIMWFLVPKILSMPSVKTLADINETLRINMGKLDDTMHRLEIERQDKEKAEASLQQAQKMEAIGRLTGGIAHDFNNLLLAISGNLELIKNSPGNTKVTKWATNGINASIRAAHLTAQLLTFSRIQKLQLVETRLSPVLSNLKEIIDRTLKQDVRLIMRMSHNPVIMADPIQLELAILNLVFNARDAMPQGGTLTIFTTVKDHHVHINVADTGTGIASDVASRIFEPFFTTKEVGKGTGLGLSMVYGVAVQSGGEVFVKKTSCKGTTFTIKLPIVDTPTVETSITEEDYQNLQLEKKYILLIDDDHAVREALEDILISLNHNVKAVEDGVEALVYLKEHKPDLILVDYIMPVMNGAEVAKAARLIYSDIPIVFITGYSESASIETYRVLKKPFGINDIKILLYDLFK